jgi:hypothetical protein
MKYRFMTISFLVAGVLGASVYATGQAPAYGGDQAPTYNAAQAQPGTANPDTANPGALNYVEGSVSLDGIPMHRDDVGRASMAAGQVLSTQTGKAEVLLTPGVFLRLDDNSAVKMISPDITPTQVELDRGRAAVEVDELYPQNTLEIIDGGVTTQLLKPGFYEFNANQPTALVFKGKEIVKEADGRSSEIKDHHEMTLAENVAAKPFSFDTRGAQDELYNWSSLRSEYLAQANNQIAGQYAGVSGFDPGWYWDPYMWDYTFIGLGPYWSPFGFGFYPPWGWYGGYWGGGYYGHRYYGGGVGRAGFAGGFGGGASRGGFGGGGGGRR